MLDYVEERGFFNPSQGDTSVALDLFTLCSGGSGGRGGAGGWVRWCREQGLMQGALHFSMCTPPPPVMTGLAAALPSSADGKYHRLDRFGLKLTDVVVPLTLPPPQPTSVASAAAEADLAGGDVGPAPEHAVGDAAGAAAVGTSSTGGGEMEYTSNKVWC